MGEKQSKHTEEETPNNYLQSSQIYDEKEKEK